MLNGTVGRQKRGLGRFVIFGKLVNGGPGQGRRVGGCPLESFLGSLQGGIIATDRFVQACGVGVAEPAA